MQGRYLMVTPVPALRAGRDSFEVESAFGEHLRMLRKLLGDLASSLVLMGPEVQPHMLPTTPLARVDEKREGIRFRGLFPLDVNRVQFAKMMPSILAVLREEVAQADVVHSGNSTLYRPFELSALLMASNRGKKTISVTDIDHRKTARMNLEAGRWSLREYWVTRLLHDPFQHLQHLLFARRCSLVLLKGNELVKDYGRGRPNVKYFLDSAFSREQVIGAEALARKLERVGDPAQELRVVYFGRLVPYKGVDAMLRAVRRALDRGARLHFEIIGFGPEEPALRALTAELGLNEVVNFAGSVQFGPKLFERLYAEDVLLAAPLSEDTPRSALDACASGQVIVAYDTLYYRELAAMGAPVVLVPWRNHQAMGDGLFELASARTRLKALMQSALAFAEDNTQELWLERRVAWTRALFAGGPPRPSVSSDG